MKETYTFLSLNIIKYKRFLGLKGQELNFHKLKFHKFQKKFN